MCISPLLTGHSRALAARKSKERLPKASSPAAFIRRRGGRRLGCATRIESRPKKGSEGYLDGRFHLSRDGCLWSTPSQPRANCKPFRGAGSTSSLARWSTSSATMGGRLPMICRPGRWVTERKATPLFDPRMLSLARPRVCPLPLGARGSNSPAPPRERVIARVRREMLRSGPGVDPRTVKKSIRPVLGAAYLRMADCELRQAAFRGVVRELFDEIGAD
jgi:hypothetical protein